MTFSSDKYINPINHIWLSTALWLLLFTCISAQGQYNFYANDQLEATRQVIGFPMIYMMDGVNSLSQTIALAPLAINICMYWIISFLLVWYLKPVFKHYPKITFCVALLFIATSLPWFIVLATLDTSFVLNFDSITSGYEVRLNHYQFEIYALPN